MDSAPHENPLHLIQGRINRQPFRRWMSEKGLTDQGHAMHCLLVECYGEQAPQPFKLIFPNERPYGVLYGYADHDAGTLRETAGFSADPLQCKALPPEMLDSKPMPGPESWAPGRKIGFTVETRPVSRIKAGRAGGVQEVDIFDLQKNGCSREQAYVGWLSRLLSRDNAASLHQNETKLMSYHRTAATRKLGQRPFHGPNALLRGNLTIGDAGSFSRLLRRGIGRHRAYGYGMLLLNVPHKV